MAYQLISDHFVNRFVELLDDAVEAEEIKPTNTRFLALEAFRSISQAIRDEQALRASGLTTEEAALLVDGLIWDGIRNRDSIGAVEGRDAMRPEGRASRSRPTCGHGRTRKSDRVGDRTTEAAALAGKTL